MLGGLKMLNVVYLVLVFAGESGQYASASIPQANMKQCQINAKAHYTGRSNKNPIDEVVQAKRIVGVMPK